MAGIPEPIAIVGIGCRLAGSVNDPAQLWTFLIEGRSDVREVPEERWEPYLRRDPRNAIVRAYYLGQTVADIAQQEQVPEGTVKSRLHYAMRALRNALQERGVGRD